MIIRGREYRLSKSLEMKYKRASFFIDKQIKEEICQGHKWSFNTDFFKTKYVFFQRTPLTQEKLDEILNKHFRNEGKNDYCFTNRTCTSCDSVRKKHHLCKWCFDGYYLRDKKRILSMEEELDFYEINAPKTHTNRLSRYMK